jgi:hypothetical protein
MANYQKPRGTDDIFGEEINKLSLNFPKNSPLKDFVLPSFTLVGSK